jgi:hypothetical protein
LGLTIKGERPEDPTEIHQQLKRKLAGGEHWGFWYLGRALANGGRSLIRRATDFDLKQENPSWFGSFSNMGDFHTASPDSDAIDWIILPGVRRQRPVAVVATIWHKRLTITCLIHQDVDVSHRDFNTVWAKIQNTLMHPKANP